MRTSRLALLFVMGLIAPVAGGTVARAGAEETGPPIELHTLPAGSVVSILGQRVFDAGGDEIGRLVDVLVTLNGQPRAGVIDVGGFMGIGTRRVAVAWSLLRFSNKDGDIRIIEDLTEDETAAAPEYRGADGADIVVGRRKAPP